jgi:hypothetical protein
LLTVDWLNIGNDLDRLREVWVFAQDCSRLKVVFGIAKSSDLRQPQFPMTNRGCASPEMPLFFIAALTKRGAVELVVEAAQPVGAVNDRERKEVGLEPQMQVVRANPNEEQ